MKRFIILAIIFPLFSPAKSQFQPEKLQLNIGYHLHNSDAKRFNNLIRDFNKYRSDILTNQDLPSLNFFRGFCGGASWEWMDGMDIYVDLHSRRQFLETHFIVPDDYYQFLFRQSLITAGVNYRIGKEKKIDHSIGGGIVVGVVQVKFQHAQEKGFPGSKNMRSIDNAGTAGLSLHYEAIFWLHEAAGIYIRPSVVYTLRSDVRNLDAFMNPVYEENEWKYYSSNSEKINKGSLSGIALEAGIRLRFPETTVVK